MEDKKMIEVSLNNWKRIMLIKTENVCKSMNEAVEIALNKYDETK